MLKLSVVRLKTALLFFLLLQVGSDSAAGTWQDIDPIQPAGKGNNAEPVYYRALRADTGALKQALAAAPLEFTSSQGAELRLPMPDGSMQRFEVENSPIMAPALAARYPEIQTYHVRGIDDPGITGRLDMTPKGFHAMLSTSAGTLFIDPDETGAYRSYTKQAYVQAKGQTGTSCLVESETAARPTGEIALRSSDQRRVYGLAVAATGEYTQFHGGTVPEALAAIVTAINRVNQIYGRDVAIQFVLVSDNDSIIYTDPSSDPYTNDNGTVMLAENQDNLDRVIGSTNYNIGHVFSTGGGGIAVVGVTCRNDFKAQGVTGLTDPVNDSFYIDLVAHEIGHQMDASHTFNGTTEACGSGLGTSSSARIAESAVEPGSGSTIMSYAGICGQEDLQDFADATFHAWSIRQIVGFSSSGFGSTCGTTPDTGNTAPIVNAGQVFTIPANTPFFLTGSASDIDGDVLSYQWDEMDANGTATDATTLGTDLGSNPLFRSFLPKDTASRTFPRLSHLLTGITDLGETLPTTPRTLNFRLTVRDGQSGVNEDDAVVTVDPSQGPFQAIGQIPNDTFVLNDGGDFIGGSSQTVGWLVGGTQTSCPQVNISLFSFNNNGTTYCDARDDAELDLGTHLNSGFATVELPFKTVSRGRVHIACESNIFFTLTSKDITVNSASGAVADDCKGIDGTVVPHGIVFNDAGEGITVVGSDGGGGGGGALILLPVLLGFRVFGRVLKRDR